MRFFERTVDELAHDVRIDSEQIAQLASCHIRIGRRHYQSVGSLRNAYQSGLPSTKRKSSLVSGDWRPAYRHVGSIRNLTFLPRSTDEGAAENPSGTKPMHSIGLDRPDLCAPVAKTDAYFRRPATAWESASLHGSLSFPRASFMQARRLTRFLSAQLCFTSSLYQSSRSLTRLGFPKSSVK
jgi:hypothetical protein